MIARVLLVLVAVILVLRALGRWHAALRPPSRGGPPVEAARRCPDCGAYVVGAQPASCGRSGCRFR